MVALTGVVIPARDEERSVGQVIAATRTTLPGALIVIVDDASSDATADVAEAGGAVVVRLDRHHGYAGALRAGYRRVLDDGATRLAQIDADGQHAAPDLLRLLAALERFDLVLGSRFMAPGYPLSLTRRAGIGACRWMTRAVAGLALTDPTSGLRAVRRELAEDIADNGFPDGLTESSFLIRLHRSGLRIGEVPVTMRPAPEGSMHDGLAGVAHFARISRATLRLALDRGRR